MKLITPWVRHLLHRRCRWCWQEAWWAGQARGDAVGYLRGVTQTRAHHERREALLRQGIDPDELERFIRERNVA